MEKELIKQINTGKLHGNKLEFAKAALRETGLYSCRLNKPKQEYILSETDFNEIKKEQLEMIRKSLFDIEKEKIRYQLKKIINNDVPLTRFSTPMEILQYKIKNKPIVIDFQKVEHEYKDKKVIPLVMLNKASYETLLNYLPNDFDPINYVKLNPDLNNLKTEREIKYHYLKFGRIKNLPYKEL
jgi:hypothetical protein